MNAEELAAARKRDATFTTDRDGDIEGTHEWQWFEDECRDAAADRRALLAHLDALTAAVESLERYDIHPTNPDLIWPHPEGRALDRVSVLALLRGDTKP